MNVKNVEKENGAAKVTIEIARDEFQTALDKAYAKIRKDIMIPGFRKGKAPRKFVERMYGSQVFYEDAVNEIFPEIYEAAIVKQEGRRPALRYRYADPRRRQRRADRFH